MSSPSRFALKIRKHSNTITFEVKNSPFYVQNGDTIIVETNRGEEAGVVQKLPCPCQKHGLHEELRIRQVLRKATDEDKQTLLELPKLEQEYLKKANEVFEEKSSNAKLISCEVLFSKKKIILYYRMLEEAEDKHDKNKKKQQIHQHKFNSKEVLKDLFHHLNIPVDLKEMGNRASAYVIGGVGHCGCGLCCTTFLHKPMQVSVKMAKEQSLAINIPKLSGVCGKLLCCIAYETSQYENGVLADAKEIKPHAEDDAFRVMFQEKK